MLRRRYDSERYLSRRPSEKREIKPLKPATPALLLDMDAVERNIKKMAEYFHGKKATHRPHVKVHKSPFIAHKQISAGANGITCAKVSEAEVMAYSGINDIMIANEIVDSEKLMRVARLAKLCNLSVLVDDLDNAKQLSEIASKEKSMVGVLLELNLGTKQAGILDRCGVVPDNRAVHLAGELARLRNIEFRGLMGYEGSPRNILDPDLRRDAVKNALTTLVETRDGIEDSGVEVGVVSCGGTMTYNISSQFPGVTEVQAGSYAVMDTTFRRFGIDFELALTVMTTVISKPRPEKIIVDAGLKSISSDHGLPDVKDRPDMEVIGLNVEHGHIQLGGLAGGAERGDRLELLTSHGDTTVCLYDNYLVTRGGEYDMTLEIAGRGKVQ